MSNFEYGLEYSNAVRETPKIYLDKIYELLNPTTSDSILEIGCNRGELISSLRESLGVDIVGIDVNEAAIRESNLSGLTIADVTKLPFENNSFSKIFSIHVLEHVLDLKLAMEEMARVLKPGGLALHAFPSYLPFVPRGFDGAFIDGFKMSHNPITALKIARKLHVHKLDPNVFMNFADPSVWKLLTEQRIFVKEEFGFSWVVLLQRI